LVQRVVLRNKRSLRLAWGWTLVTCASLLLFFFLVGGIGAMVMPPPDDSPTETAKKQAPGAEIEHAPQAGRPDEEPSHKKMDVGTFLIGMSCMISMILVFFLLPGFYLLYRARRLGEELALLEADQGGPSSYR
jgi:hypothetical protein